jgi:DNA-binding NarL/FixJ family response regulator
MGESAAKDAVAILNQPNDFQTILVDMSLPPDATVEVIKSVADKNPRSRIIAFHSHVRADLHRLAKDAGADEVIPNSQVVIRLNELLTK